MDSTKGNESDTLETEIAFSMRRVVDYDDHVYLDNDNEAVLCHEYALLQESMWFKALKWHSDYSTTIRDMGCSLAAEDDPQDVFSIQIRLSVLKHANSLVVKICRKDNPFQCYRKARQIFGMCFDQLCIWDFSGQMTQLLEADRIMLPNIHVGLVDGEVLLEVQVYGLLDPSPVIEGKKTEKVIEASSITEGSGSYSCEMNGAVGNDYFSSSVANVKLYDNGYKQTSMLGLTGLVNLGNTCFMNSAVQCLAHMPKLVDYFLGDYKKEINYENPLCLNGELALAFGDLLRKLWSPGRMPITPRLFKSTIANFAPQFSGYNQHDSQEFLAFLLDRLHEDLNCVKNKPYIEVRDAEGRPDDEVADEYWHNHLACNDSIIVDLCHGQYRSTLVCPMCKRVSITFDPFMYLSFPLPSTTMRTMILTVMSTDGISPPSSITVIVPQCGRCKDIMQALNKACSVRDDESLLVAEVYNNCILRFPEDPSDSLALLRDKDYLVAYRLPRETETENCSRLIFMHEQLERQRGHGMLRPGWRMFGIPLVTRISNHWSGSQIHKEFLKLLHPFLRMNGDVTDDYGSIENTDNEVTGMEASPTCSDDNLSSDDESGVRSFMSTGFEFQLTDERGQMKGCKIKSKEPLHVYPASKRLHVLVRWSKEMMRQYDTSLLMSLPLVLKPGFLAKKPHEVVSLYKCLEAFLKEEPLGPEDMWYCPGCKKHRQASKKLDLWRLPEILVIHLKRFSYSRFLKNKLETYVDFPIDKLDLSRFIAHKDDQSMNCYRLYAIINHYGGIGSGHYVALVYHGQRWYEFNDSSIYPASEDNIKTSVAYVLFYRRISET